MLTHDNDMEEILLPTGLRRKIAFPENVQFGSLRPVKRGGRANYFCRECYNKTNVLQSSVILKGTPHYTQSVYLDGVVESREQTRICLDHTEEWLSTVIPEKLYKDAKVTAKMYARYILLTQQQVRFDMDTLQQLYELGVLQT